MKKILILLALLAFTAGTAAAQSNISRLKGTYFQLSAEGDRGFGAGLSAGAGHVFGNGFSLSAGLGGEWNQRPNVGNNFFVTGYSEAKYSFLKTTVSPFLAARIKLRYLIPSHIQTGIETGQFYCNATQFDLFLLLHGRAQGRRKPEGHLLQPDVHGPPLRGRPYLLVLGARSSLRRCGQTRLHVCKPVSVPHLPFLKAGAARFDTSAHDFVFG